MSRYIDKDAFIADARMVGLDTAEKVLFALAHQPSIDICFCRECKYVDTKKCPMYFMGLGYTDDDFCSYGERIQVMYYPQVDGITPSVIGNCSEKTEQLGKEQRMMDTVSLLIEIEVLKKKMDNAEAFLEELIHYIFVACKDDDYITPEGICRKLYKYGFIDKKDGEWIADTSQTNRTTNGETEPQTEQLTEDYDSVEKYRIGATDTPQTEVREVCDRDGNCSECWKELHCRAKDTPQNERSE